MIFFCQNLNGTYFVLPDLNKDSKKMEDNLAYDITLNYMEEEEKERENA